MNREDLAEHIRKDWEEKICRIEFHENTVKVFRATENYPGGSPAKFADAIRETKSKTLMYDPTDGKVACV